MSRKARERYPYGRKGDYEMAVRVPEIDYYSLHGIWGAYGSLVLGRLGRGAGVVVGDVRPPRGGLFVGYRVGRGEPRLLPFSPGVGFGLGASAYREDDVTRAGGQSP